MTGSLSLSLSAAVLAFAVAGCKFSSDEPAKQDAPAASAASPVAATTPGPAPTSNATKLGAPVPATPTVALADIAKNPGAWNGKSFTTEGTVSAVCQHMGCWMEIRDDASQAHVKMAGHSFFVPKTSAGHKAKVLATLATSNAPTCNDEADCNPAAKANAPGDALSKVELVADGVEVL